MHNDEERVVTKEISAFYDISNFHLTKVVQKLAKHGFVNSVKGRYNSGIMLGKEPKDIKISNVIETFEPLSLLENVKNGKEDQIGTNLMSYLRIAQMEFMKHMKKYTLEDLRMKDFNKKGRKADIIGGFGQ